MIFSELSMSATTITAMIGIINFIVTCIGLVLLRYFGRRTLMIFGSATMAGTLFLMAMFAFIQNSVGLVVCVLIFVTGFEFSSGTIVWLYNAEIMKDKAMGIATFLIWFFALVVSLALPIAIKAMHIGYIFLFLGAITFLGTIYIVMKMKETMGLTQEQIKDLYL